MMRSDGPEASERASLPVQILLWGIIVVGLIAVGFLNLTIDLDPPRVMPPALLRP